MRVLALDQKSNDQMTEPKIAQTATLEVTPQQAETLALVSEIGTLSLALRSVANGPDDTASKTPTTLTWDSDISHVLPAPNNRTGTLQHVQILRGKDITEATFDLKP